jgi:hypothetical protein
VSNFVQVHYGARLQFPNQCPFTGASHPRGRVHVTRSRFRWLLPIPFLGAARSRHAARVTLPSSRLMAFADVMLRLLASALPLAGVAAALACLKFGPGPAFTSNPPVAFLAAGIVGSWLATLLRIVSLWRVRVTAYGRQACELRFKDETYGERFAELNSFPLGREQR